MFLRKPIAMVRHAPCRLLHRRSIHFSRVKLSERSSVTNLGYVSAKDCSTITPPYPLLLDKLAYIRKYINKPLTLAEKILYSHLTNPERTFASGPIVRGETYLQLTPERVAMQDASAQ